MCEPCNQEKGDLWEGERTYHPRRGKRRKLAFKPGCKCTGNGLCEKLKICLKEFK